MEHQLLAHVGPRVAIRKVIGGNRRQRRALGLASRDGDVREAVGVRLELAGASNVLVHQAVTRADGRRTTRPELASNAALWPPCW